MSRRAMVHASEARPRWSTGTIIRETIGRRLLSLCIGLAGNATAVYHTSAQDRLRPADSIFLHERDSLADDNKGPDDAREEHASLLPMEEEGAKASRTKQGLRSRHQRLDEVSPRERSSLSAASGASKKSLRREHAGTSLVQKTAVSRESEDGRETVSAVVSSLAQVVRDSPDGERRRANEYFENDLLAQSGQELVAGEFLGPKPGYDEPLDGSARLPGYHQLSDSGAGAATEYISGGSSDPEVSDSSLENFFLAKAAEISKQEAALQKQEVQTGLKLLPGEETLFGSLFNVDGLIADVQSFFYNGLAAMVKAVKSVLAKILLGLTSLANPKTLIQTITFPMVFVSSPFRNASPTGQLLMILALGLFIYTMYFCGFSLEYMVARHHVWVPMYMRPPRRHVAGHVADHIRQRDDLRSEHYRRLNLLQNMHDGMYRKLQAGKGFLLSALQGEAQQTDEMKTADERTLLVYQVEPLFREWKPQGPGESTSSDEESGATGEIYHENTGRGTDASKQDAEWERGRFSAKDSVDATAPSTKGELAGFMSSAPHRDPVEGYH
ncbi:unnamed protein product [Amoebophrya sp. A25]|nr:unnamed protein product [Amoebophrya sp. A25]|eukprot:GSA25T00021705001.1